MIAVIFRAELAQLDDEYYRVARQLRLLAKSKYGCTSFISVCEDDTELTISYWDNLEQVERWKRDPEHVRAQAKGSGCWYRSYQVDVTEVLRRSASNDNSG